MSTEVTLGTQPLINSVNKAVTALETLDKAVGNLGKGKSSIDILKASFKEFESTGNASVKAMAAAGNQAVTELERLNKRQTSLKGLLGRVEGTKGALKPDSLIAFRKEYESNAASIAQTVKSLQTTLAGLYSEFDRRNVSTQALRGLKQELADVEAAAKQVKPPATKPTSASDERRQAHRQLQNDYDQLSKRGEVFSYEELRRLKVASVQLSDFDKLRFDSMKEAMRRSEAAEASQRRALTNTTKFEADQLAMRSANWDKFEASLPKASDVRKADWAKASAAVPGADAVWREREQAQKRALASEIAGWEASLKVRADAEASTKAALVAGSKAAEEKVKAEAAAYQKRLQQMHDLAA